MNEKIFDVYMKAVRESEKDLANEIYKKITYLKNIYPKANKTNLAINKLRRFDRELTEMIDNFK